MNKPTVTLNGHEYTVTPFHQKEDYAERIRSGLFNVKTFGPKNFAKRCHESLPPEDAEAFCAPYPAALVAYRKLTSNKVSQNETVTK